MRDLGPEHIGMIAELEAGGESVRGVLVGFGVGGDIRDEEGERGRVLLRGREEPVEVDPDLVLVVSEVEV